MYTTNIDLCFFFFFQKTDDEDSGNEDSDLYYNTERRASQTDQNSSQDSTPIVSSPSDSPEDRAPYFIENNEDAARFVEQNIENYNAAEFRLDFDNLQIRQDVENNPQHDVLEEDFQSPEEDSVPIEESEPDQEFPVLFQQVKNYEKGESSRPWNLFKRIDLLANYRYEEQTGGELGLVDSMPPEVLLAVFSHLDDLSLWSAANVCRRWCNLISNHVTSDFWLKHVKLRWPLFKSNNANLTDWYKVYDRLAYSAPCKTCLSQTFTNRTKPCRVEENSWRDNRLRNELKGLRSDPPDGIKAIPLDRMCCQWQATITGPTGSPYEGGLFYLYLQVPHR